jgi:hypothetical protein
LSGTRLELSPSWAVAATIVALHCAAAASVVAVQRSPAGYALAVGLLGLGLAAAWGRALLRSSASVTALELSKGEIVVELRDGRRIPAELRAGRHVSRFMVTLPVRRPMRRTILISRDMLDPEGFRRLRLWALWGVAGKQLQA